MFNEKLNSMRIINFFRIFPLFFLSIIPMVSSDCFPFQDFNNQAEAGPFYLRKIRDNYYLIGTNKIAFFFKIASDGTNPIMTIMEKLKSNYKVNIDNFENIDPEILLKTKNDQNELKYILSQSISGYDKDIISLFDVEGNILKNGKFSSGYTDYQLIEIINEEEFIGAVKIISTDPNTNENIYSIKLQVMSLSKIDTNNNIKALAGKEYITDTIDYYLNDIFYISSIKKIYLIRSFEDKIFIDFIDYDNIFGALQFSFTLNSKIKIGDEKAKTIIFAQNKTQINITSCFRVMTAAYCFSGNYNIETKEYKIIQEPKILLSKCGTTLSIISLYKLDNELAVISCSNRPGGKYYLTRFNQNLKTYGNSIELNNKYVDFLVIDQNKLLLMYLEEKDDKKYIYGCIYNLPKCASKKYYLKNGKKLEFNDIFNNLTEFGHMKNISINSKFSVENIINHIDDTPIQLSNNSGSFIFEKKALYYNYSGGNSFQQNIYFSSAEPSLGPYSLAKSDECQLSIVNCYYTCEECDEVGNENINGCTKCNEEKNYFFKDNSQTKTCYEHKSDGSLPSYYYFKGGENLFKRCYTGCKSCTGEGTEENHNCKECDEANGYYEANSNKDCYHKNDPKEGYYFKQVANSFFQICGNNCLRCDSSNINSEYYCKKCNISSGYYNLFEDEDNTKYSKCLNIKPNNNYYLDTNSGEYKKCYETCETCSIKGSDEYNNCDTCKSPYKKYSIDNTYCKCPYYFYYDSNNERQCTPDNNCPPNTYLVINSKNIGTCYKKCPLNLPIIYNGQCYSDCPKGTVYDESTEECEENKDNNNPSCNLNEGKEIDTTITLDKMEEANQDFVDNFRKQYKDPYDHINVVKNENENFKLILFENEKCLEKIKDDLNLGYINLTDLAPEIKKNVGMNPDDPLVYSFLYTYDIPDTPYDDFSGLLKENIDYRLYNGLTGEEIPLENILEGKKINTITHLPKNVVKDLDKINHLGKYGANFYDPNSDFFNTVCFLFTSENGKDVTLRDRRKYYYMNAEICDSGCDFMGLDESKKNAICYCDIKKNKNLETTRINKKEFLNYKDKVFIWDMFKCMQKKMMKNKELNKSYITIIVFCILLLEIIGAVLFFVYQRNNFTFLTNVSRTFIKEYSEEKKSMKMLNHPPKSTNFPDEKVDIYNTNNLKDQNQTKGYVHNIIRPFNYDNNNLFYHADEHYTYGKNNIDDYLKNTQFNNNYNDNKELFKNDTKKPKKPKNVNPKEKKEKVSPFKHKIDASINKLVDNMDLNSKNNLNDNDSNIFPKKSPFKENLKDQDLKSVGTNDIIPELIIEPIENNSNPISNSSNEIEKYFTPKKEEEPNLSKEKIPNYNQDLPDIIKKLGDENTPMNKSPYDEAKNNDKRNFCSFYFNQLKHRQIFLYTIYFSNLAEHVIFKIIVTIFHILLCLFLNIVFYRNKYISKELHSPETNHAKFSARNAWFRILLSVLVYIIAILLLHLIYLPQLRMFNVMFNKKLNRINKIKTLEKSVKCIKINQIIFIVFNFLFISFLVVYVLVFSYVFRNSKTDLMISFLLTILFTQFLPCAFVLIVTVLRFYGLKFDSKKCYDFSLVFTI